MTIAQIDPNIQHSTAQIGVATLTGPTVDAIITTINLLVSAVNSGSGSGGGIGGIYTANGTENPGGFAITFASLSPPVTAPSSYVAVAQVVGSARGIIGADTVPFSWTGSGLNVRTASQLLNGEQVVVILVPK